MTPPATAPVAAAAAGPAAAEPAAAGAATAAAVVRHPPPLQRPRACRSGSGVTASDAGGCQCLPSSGDAGGAAPAARLRRAAARPASAAPRPACGPATVHPRPGPRAPHVLYQTLQPCRRPPAPPLLPLRGEGRLRFKARASPARLRQPARGRNTHAPRAHLHPIACTIRFSRKPPPPHRPRPTGGATPLGLRASRRHRFRQLRPRGARTAPARSRPPVARLGAAAGACWAAQAQEIASRRGPAPRACGGPRPPQSMLGARRARAHARRGRLQSRAARGCGRAAAAHQGSPLLCTAPARPPRPRRAPCARARPAARPPASGPTRLGRR